MKFKSCPNAFDLRDAPLDIWGGGGVARRHIKKKNCHRAQKSEKSWLKIWAKKKFVVGIDVDKNKSAKLMVTYRMGNNINITYYKKDISLEQNLGSVLPTFCGPVLCLPAFI